MPDAPEFKQAVISAFLGKTQDRFSEYQSPTELPERVKMVAALDGYDGVEVVYPYETGEAAQTKTLLADHGLAFAAINANIKKEPKFVPGAIGRPDPSLRADAVAIVREAKDFAAEVGAPHVSVCPLSDGHDQLLQVDYPAQWAAAVEAVGEMAAHRPEMSLFLEYKFNETRVHCLLDTCATTLQLIAAVGAKNVGVTIDFGHSMYAGENPARALALCEAAGVPYYLHTNDNDARHDWDLIAGSRHFLHYVEFLFWAAEFGYDKFFTTDASPRIFDMKGFFEEHDRASRGIWRLVHSLDRDHVRKLMAAEDHVALMRLVNEQVYRL